MSANHPNADFKLDHIFEDRRSIFSSGKSPPASHFAAPLRGTKRGKVPIAPQEIRSALWGK